MVKQIVREVFFLGQPSEPATKADIQVGKDLQDTLQANRKRCVGMAANIRGSNEPSRHACMDIWRLPRKSDAPLFAAGYLTVFHIYHQTSKKKKVGESNAGKKCINRPSV